MRVTVDLTVCESHGRCEFVAPTLFRLSDDLVLRYEEDPADSYLEQIKEAIAACPTRAISLELE